MRGGAELEGGAHLPPPQGLPALRHPPPRPRHVGSTGAAGKAGSPWQRGDGDPAPNPPCRGEEQGGSWGPRAGLGERPPRAHPGMGWAQGKGIGGRVGRGDPRQARGIPVPAPWHPTPDPCQPCAKHPLSHTSPRPPTLPRTPPKPATSSPPHGAIQWGETRRQPDTQQTPTGCPPDLPTPRQRPQGHAVARTLPRAQPLWLRLYCKKESMGP